jgi:hypothetical protein
MDWQEVEERIINDDQDGTVTWEEVKKQVKEENELEKKKWAEISKSDAEESERLRKKSKFVTNHSIKFTRDEYDKLKSAFCKGNGWSLEYPHTVNVRSITLTGSYKYIPPSEVKFQIEIEKQDHRIQGSNKVLK